MRIDRLDVYHVAMPLLYPWRTAYGEDYDIHSVLVRAVSGDHYAWAESSPLHAPTYLTESAVSVFHHVTQFFGPHVVGREYESADEINARLEVFKGNSFAKAAIEIAWWSLRSKITGMPLHRLLGGQTREVQAGADFGIQDSIDMLLGNIQKAVDAGFPRVKLKVARGWDLDMLRAVTSTFPNMTFHIDCNWIGGMLESAVGSSVCVELATLLNFTYPGDLFPTSRFYERDLADTRMELTPNNTFVPFTGPLPEPDPEMLERETVESASVTTPE